MNIGVIGTTANTRELLVCSAEIAGITVTQSDASVESIMQDSAIDAVIISSPAAFEADIFEQAARNGKHVLSLSPSPAATADVSNVHAQFGEGPARVMLGNTLRFTPLFESVHRLISEGDLGQIGVARLVTTRSREDAEAYGGSALHAMAEDIDVFQWYFGPARRVFANSISDSQDYLQVMIRFESGVIGYVENSLRHTEFRREIEVAGSLGLIRQASDETISLRVDTYEQAGKPASTVRSNPFEEHPLETQLRHFVDRVTSGEAFMISESDTLQTMDIVNAVAASVKSGEVINVTATGAN